MSVVLKIGGLVHEGWKSSRITRGLERVASDFEMTVTEKIPGATALPDIRPGYPVEVSTSGVELVTGHIDEANISFGAKTRAVTFRGRSKTADLVDCSATNEPGQWSNVSLTKIASDIAAPFGIDVVANSVGDPFATFRLQQGERAFDAIERACRIKAVLATDDALGRLVLTRSGTKRSVSAIRCTPSDPSRNNVLNGTAIFSHRDRYSKYVVKSQSVGTDDLFGDDAAQPVGTANDAGITRPRVLILQAETQSGNSGVRDRANWEASTRQGKSLRCSYELQGWFQADGSLWEPNLIVQVFDDLNRVYGDFLISEVTYMFGQNGQRVSLSVVPPKAFTLLPDGNRGAKTDPLAQYLGAE